MDINSNMDKTELPNALKLTSKKKKKKKLIEIKRI